MRARGNLHVTGENRLGKNRNKKKTYRMQVVTEPSGNKWTNGVSQ
jgi:hypothetical protein